MFRYFRESQELIVMYVLTSNEFIILLQTPSIQSKLALPNLSLSPCNVIIIFNCFLHPKFNTR